MGRATASRVRASSSLQDEVDAFARVHQLAERAAAVDRSPLFPRAEFRAMGRAGLLGLSVDPELGGRGLRLRDAGEGLRRLAFLSGTTFAKLALQPEFCSVLAEHGSPALVDEFYRPLIRGELLVGNQITEPNAGSDLGGLATTARRSGDEYILRGTKTQAAFATEADAAIVYAKGPAEGHADVTALLVLQTLPGVRRSSVADLGERWMRRGTVEYDEVRVPATHRIGEDGEGLRYLRTELTHERALLAAIYLGVGRFAWESTVAHVGARLAFGRPLSDQEAVAFPLVEDGARLDSAELYLERTLRRLESGSGGDAEAALSKWLATEVSLESLDHAIQFHGGRGYSTELPFERLWRDVRSGALAHGSSEIMHVVAARALWPRAPNRNRAPSDEPAAPGPRRSGKRR